MKSMRVGWMMFPEYCRLRNIKQNGHESRTLVKLDDQHKENVTPNACRATWTVNVNEADKVFGGNKHETT